MTNQQLQDIKSSLQYALDEGTFANIQASYNTLMNSINLIDEELNKKNPHYCLDESEQGNRCSIQCPFCERV